MADRRDVDKPLKEDIAAGVEGGASTRAKLFAAGDTDSAALVEDLLSRLKITDPKPPAKVGAFAMTLGGVADILRASARGLQGGLPQQGAFVTRLRQDQQRFEAEESAAQSKRDQIANVFTIDQFERLQERIAAGEKHQADFEANVAMENHKAGLRAGQSRLEAMLAKQAEVAEEKRGIALRLIEEGKLASGTDPNTLTYTQLFAAAAKPGVVPQAQVDAIAGMQAGLPPDLQLEATLEPGQPPKIRLESKDIEQLKGKALTASTKGVIARQTGIDVTNRTDEEILDDASKWAKDNSFKIPSSVQRLLQPQIVGSAQARRILTMLKNADGTDRDIFGPGPTAGGFFASDAERKAFRTAADNMASSFIASRSGAQVSDKEFDRLKNNLPKLGKFHKNNLSAVLEFIAYFDGNTQFLSDANSIPVVRMDRMRENILNVMEGIPIIPEDTEHVWEID